MTVKKKRNVRKRVTYPSSSGDVESHRKKGRTQRPTPPSKTNTRSAKQHMDKSQHNGDSDEDITRPGGLTWPYKGVEYLTRVSVNAYWLGTSYARDYFGLDWRRAYHQLTVVGFDIKEDMYVTLRDAPDVTHLRILDALGVLAVRGDDRKY